MKAKANKLIALLLSAMLSFSILGVTAYAEENVDSGYVESDSYALNFGGKYGDYFYEYTSPCNPLITYTRVTNEPYTEWTGVNRLYNTLKPEEYVQVYCVDEYTSLKNGYFYQRANLEDSDFYSDEAATMLRAVMLNGFPRKSVAELAEAAGVEGLTRGEAANATQLAIWKAAYGEELLVHEYAHELNYWCTRNSYPSKCAHHADCVAEQASAYNNPENLPEISARIETVYRYLMNLQPVSPQNKTVSNSSFVSWSDTPVRALNADGTYNVTVSAAVNVVKQEGDRLTLSAVLGEQVAVVDLNNGQQEVSLTIQNVPAAYANGAVKLAIDGIQTVEDVYMYEAKSNSGGAAEREEQQRLIGYSGMQLPVHAEITVEPERVLRFYKTSKIAIGENEQGETIHTRIPLSGITFDIYLAAEMEPFVNGDVTLPETIDLVSFGGENYPDYTLITDDNGEASVSLTKNNLPDGVYVVIERNNAAVKAPVKPFYVMIPNTNAERNGWEYDVLVQPKNDVIDGPAIRKDVIEIEHEDKFGDEEQSASVAVGEEFTWIVRGDVPVDLADARKYVITDELDHRLTFTGKEDVVVKVEKVSAEANSSASEGNVLTEGVDYTLTVENSTVNIDGNAKDVQSWKLELSSAGRKKVAGFAAANSVDANLDDKVNCSDMEVRVYFNTVIDADAVVGEMIPNDATLEYISSIGFRYVTESDDPAVYTCGINVYKYNAKNEAEALGGARFKLVKAVDANDPDAVALVTQEGAIVYVVDAWFYDNPAMVGEKKTEILTSVDDPATAEVNEAGLAYMYGLAEGDYYLIETKAPAGFNLLRHPVKVQLGETNSLGTARIANSNAFILPETGGIGTLIFKICGGALIVVAIAVLVVKKVKEGKEEDDEEEEIKSE